MAGKNWQKYLDEIQLSYLPISLASVGVFLVLAVSRNVVFSDFQPPVWLLILDVSSIAILAISLLVLTMQWLRPADARVFLFLCFAAVALRPSVIGFVDGTPGTLILCSVIFVASLLFFTYLHMLASQLIALSVWAVVAGELVLTPAYLVTVALALATSGVGLWLQRIRLAHLKHNFDLENRLEDLETIVPMCASCKYTRDESGNWMSVEEFIESQQESAQISHAICPGCKESLYGDMLRESRARRAAQAS